MFLDPVTESEITKIVNGLKNSSSSGPYSITTKVVKSIFPSKVVPLKNLLIFHLNMAFFRMLSSVLGLLFCIKVGQEMIQKIINQFSKIFEKAMLPRLLKFLKSKSFIMIFNLVSE